MEIKQYYSFHVTYFLLVSIIGAVLIWIPKSISKTTTLIDALYNVVSAVTVTGLVATRAKGETVFDGFVLTTIMILGSRILTSLLMLYVRRYKLYRRIKELDHEFFQCVLEQQEIEAPYNAGSSVKVSGILENVGTILERQEHQIHGRPLWFKFWGKRILMVNSTRTGKEHYHGSKLELPESTKAMYLEHDAVVLLSRVVLIYMIGVQILGFIVAESLVLLSPHALHVLEQNGVNHLLFSWFAVVSMFNQSGYSVVYENIMALRTSSALMLWLGLMILMGNTMLAPCLRGIIWILHSFSKKKTRLAYEYLLDHPRLYTHLFPRTETIWLMITILGFNGFQAISFLLSEWNTVVLEGIKTKDKLIMAVFQAVSTRNAGARIVNFWQLSPAMLIVFAAMMYISPYPVVILRKTTGMRTKKGIYKQILRHSRRLLAKDSVYLVMALFLLCILERRKIVYDGLNFSIFNIIFEISSGYGNAGLSVGYSCQLTTSRPCTDVPFSLSGLFSVAGKLVIIVVMLLGRHRGLWDVIAAVITLPESYKFIYTPNRAYKITDHMHDEDVPVSPLSL